MVTLAVLLPLVCWVGISQRHRILINFLSTGDRRLRVLYTPGHTSDSISLVDMGTGVLFSGDFICPVNERLLAYLAFDHSPE